MITITWHLFVLVLVALFTFCFVVTRGTKGRYGSPREIALLLWFVGCVVTVLIYGGFVWW